MIPKWVDRDLELDSDPLTNVARGVALLDAKRPGWERDIHIDTLDLRSPSLCILGQLHDGHYSDGCTKLEIGIMEPYGFCPYADEVEETHAEWVRVISERVN